MSINTIRKNITLNDLQKQINELKKDVESLRSQNDLQRKINVNLLSELRERTFNITLYANAAENRISYITRFIDKYYQAIPKKIKTLLRVSGYDIDAIYEEINNKKELEKFYELERQELESIITKNRNEFINKQNELFERNNLAKSILEDETLDKETSIEKLKVNNFDESEIDFLVKLKFDSQNIEEEVIVPTAQTESDIQEPIEVLEENHNNKIIDFPLDKNNE